MIVSVSGIKNKNFVKPHNNLPYIMYVLFFPFLAHCTPTEIKHLQSDESTTSKLQHAAETEVNSSHYKNDVTISRKITLTTSSDETETKNIVDKTVVEQGNYNLEIY